MRLIDAVKAQPTIEERTGHLNTADLIEREAIRKALWDAVDDINPGYYECDGIDADDIDKIVDSVPSTERVAAIHCAECKFFQCNMSGDGYLAKGVPEFECRHWCGEVDPTDYCSFAERR